MLVWKNSGRVQLFRLAIARFVIIAENSIKADPAAHIPSCFRDRREKMDLSSVCEIADGGGIGVALSDGILRAVGRLV
jgi:hypothetical protein